MGTIYYLGLRGWGQGYYILFRIKGLESRVLYSI